jgi:thiol-disulfide isomerase/thioredoxin
MPPPPPKKAPNYVVLAVIGVIVLVVVVPAIAVFALRSPNTTDGVVEPLSTSTSRLAAPTTRAPGDSTPSSQSSSEFQPSVITGQPLTQAQSGADPAAQDPAVGQAAPKVAGRDFTGAPLDLIVAGKPNLIVFGAHWCPHCRREIPVIVRLAQSGKLDGLELTLVATGSNPDRPNFPPSKWLADEKWPARIMADDQSGSIFDAFGGGGYPTLVFVGRDGNVVGRFSGEASESTIEELARRTTG